MGRAVLTRGDHATLDELPAKARRGPARGDPLRFDPRPRLVAPDVFPSGALNRLSVRAFNELWFRKAPVRHTGLESIATFFHPLDGIGEWNRIYGPRGFVQYQFVVPFGARESVRAAVRRLSDARCPSFLAVLKRLGAGNTHPLSFPAPGWTLALDIPAGLPGLAALLDGLDELVAEAGGRVYLSKDSRLRPDLLAAMYPDLDRWRELRAKLDPSGVFVSDLARRLALTAAPAPVHVRDHL
jgi:decaprenylphospho-beta-D-ribofuranose 2-oxidase